MTKKDWLFSTKSIHVGNHADAETGAVSPPIQLTTTYKQDGIGHDRGYDYSRSANPTRERFEENIAALEGGDFGFAFSSGMAGITALFQFLNAGDHVLVSRNVYGGTYRLASKVLTRHGLNFDFVDTRELDRVKDALQPSTKMVFVETPTNPLLELVDLEGVASICRDHGIYLAVDNTFMSPYGQRPLSMGAHIVIHSSTKYIGGHSDVLGGALVTGDPSIAEEIRFIQKSAGAVPSPFDCWLLLRSTKTLALRVQRQADNAAILAKWLQKSLPGNRVIYPGLESHPQHELAGRQQRTPNGKPIYGSIISMDLESRSKRDRVLSKLKLFTLAESLGGVESLISNPFVMTHGDVPVEDKVNMGITENLVRLSVGIEDIDDLVEDLGQALGT